MFTMWVALVIKQKLLLKIKMRIGSNKKKHIKGNEALDKFPLINYNTKPHRI